MMNRYAIVYSDDTGSYMSSHTYDVATMRDNRCMHVRLPDAHILTVRIPTKMAKVKRDRM